MTYVLRFLSYGFGYGLRPKAKVCHGRTFGYGRRWKLSLRSNTGEIWIQVWVILLQLYEKSCYNSSWNSISWQFGVVWSDDFYLNNLFVAKQYVSNLPFWSFFFQYLVKWFHKRHFHAIHFQQYFQSLITKGDFFQKVRFIFQISKSQKKKYSKKLSWAWNLNFPPITIKCYWWEI